MLKAYVKSWNKQVLDPRFLILLGILVLVVALASVTAFGLNVSAVACWYLLSLVVVTSVSRAHSDSYAPTTKVRLMRYACVDCLGLSIAVIPACFVLLPILVEGS